MGLDKTQFRKSVKLSFDNFNKDKNSSISLQEFSVLYSGSPYSTKLTFTSLFYASDVNKNGSLSFSEYEDAFYSYLQANMTIPYEPSPIQSAMPAEPPVYVGDPGYGGDPTPGYGDYQPLPVVEPIKK